MSSFQIRAIREISSDPLAKFASELSKKLSRFLTKDQLDLLDDREDIYTDGQDFDTVVRYHDELVSTKTFNFSTQFFPTTEPDLNKLTLWFRGRMTGNSLYDWSGFRNDFDIEGEPLVVDGSPFDHLIHTAGVKSIALRFNRPTSEFVNREFVGVEDNARLQVSGISTGISYFMRIKLHAIDEPAGVSRRLFEKTDDGTPNNGVVCRVTSDGRLHFQVVRGGVTTVVQTGAGTITTDTVYDIWFTYNVTGPAIKIYINNVDQTLTTPSATPWHGSPSTNFDMRIMKRGPNAPSGYVYGDLYEFRVYREKVVSSTEVGQFHTNKWTIANTAAGQCMIANYWATYDETGTESFTSTSFTTTSFT